VGPSSLDQHRRRNLRIAIPQLERAELYVVALYSLDLEDREAEANVNDLLGRLRSPRQYLLELKLTASASLGVVQEVVIHRSEISGPALGSGGWWMHPKGRRAGSVRGGLLPAALAPFSQHGLKPIDE
jgi:hypothetical protein